VCSFAYGSIAYSVCLFIFPRFFFLSFSFSFSFLSFLKKPNQTYANAYLNKNNLFLLFPSATMSKRMRFASAAEWAYSYFQYDAHDGLLKCTAGGHDCDKTGEKKGYQKTTSKQNLVEHLTGKKHALALPEYLVEKKKLAEKASAGMKMGALTTHFASSQRETQEELLTVAYAMHPVAFHLLDDPVWRAAHSASLPQGYDKKKATALTLELDRKKQEMYLANISGPFALELDGGKSISGNKLLAFVIIYNGQAHLFKLVDTDLVELDGETYRRFIKNVVQELRAKVPKGVLLSLTLDNEASPNLGVRLLLEEQGYRYLLHIQCGPHTLELLMEKIFKALPGLVLCCEKVNEIAKHIKNHKSVQKKLFEAQDQEGRVLRMRLSNNTRKWSGRFLANARALQLQESLDAVDATEAEFPEMPLWPDVQDAQVLLFPFYLLEQVLQRDCSGLLHYSWAYFQIVHVVSDLVSARVVRQGDAGLAQELNNDLEKVEEKFKRCGVLHLCYVLWPYLPQEKREECHREANRELGWLVNKRWEVWQRHAAALSLPTRFREQEDGPEKKQDFIAAARQELTAHLFPQGEVLEAQTHFREHSVLIEDFLRSAGNAPKSALKASLAFAEKEQASLFNTTAYYDTVACDLPVLRFLVQSDLSKCAASEAATERVFSSEGVLHDRNNNQQLNDKTTARIRLGWGKKAELRRAALRASSSGADEV
jgi:hypothetical protein